MMLRLVQPLFLLLTQATDKELARMVEYLKAENRLLRSRLPERIEVTPRERARLVKLGKKLGSKLKDLISVVSYRTFRRWLQAEAPAPKKPKRPPGRPKTEDKLRQLVLQLARDTGWGYTRILGELKKLGITRLCKTTIKNILKEAGLDPGPKRGEGTWTDFLQRHAQTLWSSDFFSVKSLTTKGLVDLYVLFFLHVDSRQVFLAGVTAQPDKAWVTQMARNAVLHFAEQEHAPTHLLIDHDSKYVAEFDAVLEAEDIEVKRLGPLAPNLNAYAERWVQSVRHECLDHFVVFGERHLRHLLDQYLAYYHQERPHQAKGNAPLVRSAAESPSTGEVVCHTRLGGLLKHYIRRAA
jgi:putative transposase